MKTFLVGVGDSLNHGNMGPFVALAHRMGFTEVKFTKVRTGWFAVWLQSSTIDSAVDFHNEVKRLGIGVAPSYMFE